MRHSTRPTIFFVMATALWFLSLALVLYEFDRQHYMNAKRELITANSPRFFPPPDELAEAARPVLFGLASQQASATRELQRRLEEIVKSDSSVYWFQLIDPQGSVVLETKDSGKPSRLNTWSNSLFLRNFSGKSSQNISKGSTRPGEPRVMGRLVFHYTSPPGYAPIEELTARYRLFVLLIFVVGIAGYYLLYRYILRPVQNVAANVERSKFERPQLIWRARGPLERAYNNIASQALLQQIRRQLGSMAQSPDRTGLMQEALGFVREAFGIERICVTEFSGDGEELTILEQAASPSEAVCQHSAFPVDDHYIGNPDGAFSFSEVVVNSRVSVTGKLRTDLPGIIFRLDTMHEVCRTIREGLLSVRVHQENIFRERSEANIVLSKNLGHDLTNIIATSKLDLMAIKNLLNSPGQQPNGPKGELLRQSVNGVLESTRFLQEIVNIYRSFSYVKRPQYERHHLNDLVEQFLQAFEPSVSARIRIHREFQGAIPSLILEPRLLKLALFNVLTNALDAIKRDISPNPPPPQVIVGTEYNPDTGEYRITIADNGPGIRDAEGRLLARAELDKIFQFGYSTKSESSEGLGLSWVRTIIEDFHSGSVQAENLADRGARIALAIRSMEASEARIRDDAQNRTPNGSATPERKQG